MFGIGSTELLVILVVALLVLGPKNLPKIAGTLGKAMGEFRRYSTEFQRTLNTEIAFEEQAEKKRQKEQEQEKKETEQKSADPAPAASAPETPVQTAASSDEPKLGSLEIPVPEKKAEETVVTAELVPPADSSVEPAPASMPDAASGDEGKA